MSWQRVRTEFEALLASPDEERQQRLRELETTDRWLAEQLRDLLAHDAAAGAFLERCATTPPRASAGELLGRYRLVRPLGSGGMASVWEAEQEDPRRRVALKLVAGSRSAAEQWRFAHEAQVLARLRHPAIATFFDAGSGTVGGREVAWLALELVDGATDLVQWLAARALPRDQRIARFLELADAVAYGHRQGVLHRDLKPANVLVGADGRLKLIDFGVARALQRDGDAAPAHTRTGEIVGTLQFMAPEQVRGDTSAIGAAADVYALGVILYHVLCGRAPFEFGNRSLAAIARAVLEEEPLPPRADGRDLPADLGWIVLRALEKDPARRYPTVDALADDLRRWRAHEPVQARPARLGYRAAKLVRRHRVAVAVAAAFAVALAVAIAGLWRGLQHAHEGALLAQQGEADARFGEAVARRHQAAADEALRVVMELFEGIDDTASGREVAVHELLDAGTPAVAALGDPRSELFVRTLRGNAYARIGRFPAAGAEYERALALLPVVASEAAAAGELLRPGVSEPVVQALLGGVLVRTSEHARGEALLRDAVAATAGSDGPARARVLRTFCELLGERNRDAELLPRAEELATIAARSGDEVLRFHADRWLAKAASALERHELAVPAAARAWQAARALFGDEHKLTCMAFASHVDVLHRSGDLDAAEPLYPELIARTRRVFGDGHDHVLTVLANQVDLLWRRQKRAEAVAAMRAIVAAHDARGVAMTAAHLRALHNLGQVLSMSGRFADAEPLLARAAAATRTLLAADDPDGARMRFNHGACLAWGRRLADAEPILLAEYEALQRALPPDHADLGKLRRTIADAYRHNGRPDDAAAWRSR